MESYLRDPGTTFFQKKSELKKQVNSLISQIKKYQRNNDK